MCEYMSNSKSFVDHSTYSLKKHALRRRLDAKLRGSVVSEAHHLKIGVSRRFTPVILLVLCASLCSLFFFHKKGPHMNLIYSYQNVGAIDYSTKYSHVRHAIHESPKALFTFIIPCYKQVQYLKQCLDSIIFQKWFKKRQNPFAVDIQIIVVFDEPKSQNTMAFCAEYVKNLHKHRSKVRVQLQFIFKQNGGLADARNIGFRHSIGKWITTVDADDKLLKNFFVNFERTATDHDVSNRSLSKALNHISIIAPSLLIGENTWANQDLKTKNVIYNNLFHCSVVINRNFLSSFNVKGKYCQWWQEPYFFFGWEDWNFWIHSRIRMDHVLYVEEPWVFYSSGTMHRLCVEHRTYCRALFRVANSNYYDKQKIWNEMRILATENVGSVFESHSRWNRTLDTYQNSFSVPLIWASLFSLRQNKTDQALDYFLALKSSYDLSTSYDTGASGVIHLFGRYLKSHLLENCPGGIQNTPRYRAFERFFEPKKSKIVFSVPANTPKEKFEKFLDKIPKMRISSAYNKVSVIYPYRSSPEPLSDAPLNTMVVDVDLKSKTRTINQVLQLNHFGSLFSGLHSTRLGFVDSSHTRLLLEKETETEVPEKKIYRLSRAKWVNLGSPDLNVGWKARMMAKDMSLNRDQTPKDSIMKLMVRSRCDDLFGNKVEAELCHSILVLYDAVEFSDPEIVEAMLVLATFVPREGVFFDFEKTEYEYGPLEKYRLLLKHFVVNGCISGSNVDRLGLSPLDNTFLWWVSQILIQQPCNFGNDAVELRQSSIRDFLSRNSWAKTEKCGTTFVTKKPQGPLIHFIFENPLEAHQEKLSLTGIGSALHHHHEAQLMIHTDQIEVRDTIKNAVHPSWAYKVRFSPLCDSFLSSIHQSPFIQKYTSTFANRKTFEVQNTFLYKYLLMYALGGLYVENGVIFFQPTTDLGNFIVGESRSELDGTVMKFEKWHSSMHYLLENIQYAYSESEEKEARKRKIADMLLQDSSVALLSPKCFDPVSETNGSDYALSVSDRYYEDIMIPSSYGVQVQKIVMDDIGDKPIVEPTSILGRISNCAGCIYTLTHCPLAQI